jgi:bifunctional lysine-specific demethylase and histidyl-hydroxylase NO66
VQTDTHTTSEGPAHRTRGALARCVADPDALHEAWGRRPILSLREELPRPFDDLIDLRAVDEILGTRGLRTPFVRVVHDGQVIDAARWTRGGGVGAEIADQVDEAAIARLFADGATVVLQALHRTWPPVAALAGDLTLELGHPVQVNAYVTPPGAQGFAAHYDVHDVLVLQFAGEKRWIVHEPVLEAPLRTQPWTQRRDDVIAAARTEPALDVVLRAGDALYLPRGWIHAAEAESTTSGHLTVGIHVVTRQSLAQALLDDAAGDPELRRALPFGLDLTAPDELLEEIAGALAALERAADDPDRAIEALRARVWRSSPPGALSPLAQASATPTPELVVQLRSGLRLMRRGDDLVLPDRTIPVPDGAHEMLDELADRRPQALGDLPGATEDVLAAAATLLRVGVLVPHT